MGKNSFLLYTSDYKCVKDLPLEQKGALLDAIFEYASTGTIIDLPPVVSMAFNFFRSHIDDNTEKWNEKVEKRRAAGRLGGLAKAENSKQSQANLANAKDAKQSQANVANLAVNVNDNVLKENTLKGVKEKRFAPPTPENVRGYCREMGYTNVDAERFVDFYASKDWMVGKNRMKDWKAAVRNWARQDHSSAAGKQKKNAFLNFDDRGTDYDAMVAEEARRMIQDSGGGTDEQH